MRIAIIASGSRGDVEPYLALGKGLLCAGHEVLLVTHANFAPLVASHGLEYRQLSGSVQGVAEEMAELLERGNFLAILAHMRKEAKRAALESARLGLAACAGTDLLVSAIGGLFIAHGIAEKLALPLVQAHYIPLTPTRAYPSFVMPQLPPWLGIALNRPSYQVARQVLWQAFRPADRIARRDVLGIRPAPFFGPFDSEPVSGMPLLYGYSPAVIPPPPDWPESVHVTGYWFADPPASWTPPAALVAFLEAGPPPAYVGFGSMSSRDPAGTARLVLEALERAGQRGIILSGWAGMQQAHLPSTVLQIEGAPFAWLFPRLAAVVHHGGAGTTASGLRAGVPSVVIPFFGDQPFWGRRIFELGAGPAPIPRRRLTVDNLAAALTRAVTDPGIRSSAALLGEKLRSEDGVGRAVEIIGRIAPGVRHSLARPA